MRATLSRLPRCVKRTAEHGCDCGAARSCWRAAAGRRSAGGSSARPPGGTGIFGTCRASRSCRNDYASSGLALERGFKRSTSRSTRKIPGTAGLPPPFRCPGCCGWSAPRPNSGGGQWDPPLPFCNIGMLGCDWRWRTPRVGARSSHRLSRLRVKSLPDICRLVRATVHPAVGGRNQFQRW